MLFSRDSLNKLNFLVMDKKGKFLVFFSILKFEKIQQNFFN